jgi:hypothetical protein
MRQLYSSGAGNDVIVLGTTVGADRIRQQAVTLAAGFGDDAMVVNPAMGFGADHLNVGAFLSGANPQRFGRPNTNNPDHPSDRVAATNGTTALVTTLVKLFVDAAVQTAPQAAVCWRLRNVGFQCTPSRTAWRVTTRLSSVKARSIWPTLCWNTLTAASFTTGAG